jgi:hypothetical protein
MWGVLFDERIGLYFIISAGPRQRSRRVLVPRHSGLHFSLSDSKLPQPGGSDSCIYISQEEGGPVIPSGIGFVLGFIN